VGFLSGKGKSKAKPDGREHKKRNIIDKRRKNSTETKKIQGKQTE